MWNLILKNEKILNHLLLEETKQIWNMAIEARYKASIAINCQAKF